MLGIIGNLQTDTVTTEVQDALSELLARVQACDDLELLDLQIDTEAQPDFPVIVGVMP